VRAHLHAALGIIKTLKDDLRGGRWDARHGHVRERDAADVGLRLVTWNADTT
jgi:hypothetical protein